VGSVYNSPEASAPLAVADLAAHPWPRFGNRKKYDPRAYQLLLTAIPAIFRLDKDEYLRAGADLHQTLTIEPEYAAAHAWYAYWHIFLVGQGWAEDPRAAMAAANAAAEQAVRLDPFDAKALTIAGHVRAFLHRRLEEAAAFHERALAVDPNLPMAWAFSGVALSYGGQQDEALERLDRYKHLSPHDPHAFFFDGAMMLPRLLLGRHAEAAAIGKRVIMLKPGLSASYKPYIAAIGHLGDRQEADWARGHLLALEPNFTVSRFLAGTPFAAERDRNHYAQGLLRAGIPEH